MACAGRSRNSGASRALSEQAGAHSLHVIATAAAREATNGPDFIHRAEDILGSEIRVLSGREEATYSALGVISSFQPANGIVGDLGGGSLELIDVSGKEIGDGITLPLGSLRLHDMSKGSAENWLPRSRASRSRGRACSTAAADAPSTASAARGGTWRGCT